MIIGAQIPQNKRLKHWQAMQFFKSASRELMNNPNTVKVAIADEIRYNNLLKTYVH